MPARIELALVSVSDYNHYHNGVKRKMVVETNGASH